MVEIDLTADPGRLLPADASNSQPDGDQADIAARMAARAEVLAQGDPAFGADTARRLAVLLGAVHAGADESTAVHDPQAA